MAQAVEVRRTVSDHVRTIRDRYLDAAGGDALLALDHALSDALADLCEAERRSRRRDRLISRGFVRGRVPDAE